MEISNEQKQDFEKLFRSRQGWIAAGRTDKKFNRITPLHAVESTPTTDLERAEQFVRRVETFALMVSTGGTSIPYHMRREAHRVLDDIAQIENRRKV